MDFAGNRRAGNDLDLRIIVPACGCGGSHCGRFVGMCYFVVRVHHAAVFLAKWAGYGGCETAFHTAIVFRNDKWIYGGHLFAARGVCPILLFSDYEEKREKGRDTDVPIDFSGVRDYNFIERIMT